MVRVCAACKQPLPESDGPSWTFTLELEPPSQNVVSQNKGKGRHLYRVIRDNYQFLFRAHKNRLAIPDATGKRRVFITRLYTGQGKKRDRGNLTGGCKPLLDAMTRAALLIDDKEAYLEDHYEQVRCDRKGVTICIEEMEWKRKSE